jgi:ATP-binding cassette subfamily B protein
VCALYLHSNFVSDRPSASPSSLGALVRGHRVATFVIAVASTVGGLCEAVFLVLATRLAFAVTKGQDEMGVLAGQDVTINSAVVLALLLVVLRFLLAALVSRLATRITVEVTAALRRSLMHAFLHASWERQQADRAGRLQAMMINYASAGSTLVGSFTGLLSASLGLLALLSLAVAVDPLGALGIIVGVGVLGSVLRPIRSAIRVRSSEASSSNMALSTGMAEFANLGLELQVFGVQEPLERRVHRMLADASSSDFRLGVSRGLVPNLYTGLAYLVLVIALFLATLSDSASLTSLGAVMLVMLRSLSYGQQIQVSAASITSARQYVVELADEIDSYRAAEVMDDGGAVGSVGPLQLDEVTFEYQPGQPVLGGLTATIQPCEVVGVIGPSGSGKTTLVQLLLGLRRPTSGKVLADGRDISSFARAEWVRKVTFVPQSPRLVRGTVADNIRFFRDDITDEQVERAARLAHLHEDVMGFPEGYGRDVGEGGGQLSGGQQQRLCIARALVESPDVLILDEPTSSLDVRSESLVRETLGELRQQMTVIVIAHRMSTLDICDRIMVIQHGVLKAFDTPQRLEAESAFYREALVLSGLGGAS